MASSRQLAAIMFTDIVGYTALMGADEQRAFTTLQQNRLLQKPLIEQHNGKWIKELGDGVLASFSTVSDAVRCAIAIQNACNQTQDFRLRIGIHQGEVIFENEDVFGDSVNIASRIQALAPVGGIWVSEAVHHNIANKEGIANRFVREEKLKNVQEPVRIYEISLPKTGQEATSVEVARIPGSRTQKAKAKLPLRTFGLLLLLLAGLLYLFVFRGESFKASPNEQALEKSIAVLYFDNMSGDPSQDYFSDGITEEIIAKLSHLNNLRVISRTSVFPYKNKRENIKDIARTLNCNNILEGSVRKSGNKIRITAQLIDAAADKHLWSQIFDRELNDIFDIQSSVAESIAEKFNVSMSPATQAQIGHHSTTNMEAYDLYLQAKAIAFINVGLGVGSPVNSRKRATANLRKAIGLDPSFSEALALLSQILLGDYYTEPDSRRLLDSAKLLAQKSIAYNPTLGDGYLALGQAIEATNPDSALGTYQRLYRIDPLSGLSALGYYYRNRGDFVKAMKYFTQQVHDEPNKVDGYLAKANVYRYLGQQDSALFYLSKAKTLDPNNRNTLVSEVNFYQFKGEAEATKKAAALAFGGDAPAADKEVAIAYLFKKDWGHAEQYYLRTNYRDMDYALVLWRTNRKDSARLYFQDAIGFRKRLSYNYGMDLSRIYAALGDKVDAIKNMQLGFSLGWHEYDWMKNDPFWDEIRNTPEFKREEQLFDQRNAAMLQKILENEKRGVLPDLDLVN